MRSNNIVTNHRNSNASNISANNNNSVKHVVGVLDERENIQQSKYFKSTNVSNNKNFGSADSNITRTNSTNVRAEWDRERDHEGSPVSVRGRGGRVRGRGGGRVMVRDVERDRERDYDERTRERVVDRSASPSYNREYRPTSTGLANMD